MNLLSFFQKFKNREKDSIFWEDYFQFFEQSPSKKTPIRNLRFVVLDTETSGLDYKKDKLLSIAALSVQDFQIEIGTRFEAFFYHENYQPDESVKVHGIMGNHLKTGRTEKDILIDFLSFLKDGIVVGHHIGFDMAIINQALKKHFDIKLKNRTLDTAWLAKRVENPFAKGFNPMPLDKLCEEYQIPLGKRHTAAGDTFITALLFLKLMGKLERRGVQSYGSLF